MESENIEVRQLLIDAGHGARPGATRAELHSTLMDLYHADPDGNEELVERLRSILAVADKRAEQADLEREFLLQDGIKGCPVCDLEPTFTAQGSIVCPRHAPETVGTHCAPLKEAIVSWNDDDNWIQMGAEHLRTRDRTIHPFPAHVDKMRINANK